MILSRERSAVTQEALNEWFVELHQYMTTAGYPDIFDDPTRIYNADESGFLLALNAAKFFTTSGTESMCIKLVYRHRSGK